MGTRTNTSTETSMIGTTTGAGTTVTDTSIVSTEIATSAPLDGATGKRPVGAIAGCRRAKPRNTDAGLTCTRAVPTTTTRMRVGGSSFVDPSSRFTVA